MPRLSDPQFGHYEFRAHTVQVGPERAAETNVVVARHHENGIQALGSMRIERGGLHEENYTQSLINRGYQGHAHHVQEEPGGQTAMAGGTFEPVHSRVSWLGMSEDAPKTVLKGMLGLGVAMHGSMPVADYDLSQHGSKISQGAARKYGVKPHPSNPEMERTFTYDDPDDEPDLNTESEYQARVNATTMWQQSNYGSIGRMGNEWRSFSPEQVHHITRDVEQAHLGKQFKTRASVHPGQGKLF